MAAAGFIDGADKLSSKVSEIVINESSESPDDAFIKRWGFSRDELYKLCLRFYKENEGKANQLQVKYADSIQLAALQRQAVKGKCVEGSGNEPGLLDVVGNDRRVAWQALENMSKERAKEEFIQLLDSSCPPLKPFILAHKTEMEALEEKRREGERKSREAQVTAAQAVAQSAALQQQHQLQQQQSPEHQRLAMQHLQIRQALNQQTEQQFLSYAQAQCPGSTEQQQALIAQLQEQHFQQYMEQYMKQLYLQQQQQQQPQAVVQQQLPSAAGAVGGSSGGAGTPVSVASVNGLTASADATGSDDSESLSQHIQDASAWTKREVAEFKASIKKESQLNRNSDSIINVGSGETVTIRVPTHSQGKCLFWEFATDYYDIAFGVYFEWSTPSEGTGVEVHISDSEDEEDEESTGPPSAAGDPEKGGGAASADSGPPIDEIIPIFRRDSHDEVYCGSHVYPGKGVYLLKFDNSYSLWRSKTLYYRVYYSS